MNVTETIKSGRTVNITGETFAEEINLIELGQQNKFTPTQHITKINSSLYFENCTFEKPFIAYINDGNTQSSTQFASAVSFINCKFNAGASFNACTFVGSVDFTGTTFNKKSSFQDCTFQDKTSFFDVHWNCEAKFQNSRFYQRTKFVDASANQHFMMQGCVFRDDVNFGQTKFDKYVDFSLSRFYGQSSFNYANWSDRATFSNSTIFMNMNIIDAVFGEITFKNQTQIGDLIIKGGKVSGQIVYK